nr:MAG TPA: hypothetical protein [Caudoviricetes sp.]
MARFLPTFCPHYSRKPREYEGITGNKKSRSALLP